MDPMTVEWLGGMSHAAYVEDQWLLGCKNQNTIKYGQKKSWKRVGLITKEVRVKMSKAPRPQRGFPDVNGGTNIYFSSQAATQLIEFLLGPQTTPFAPSPSFHNTIHNDEFMW